MNDRYIIVAREKTENPFEIPNHIWEVNSLKQAIKLYSQLKLTYGNDLQIAKVVVDYGEEI